MVEIASLAESLYAVLCEIDQHLGLLLKSLLQHGLLRRFFQSPTSPMANGL